MAEDAQALNAGKGRDLASRETPLIRNDWYVAATAAEVTRKPMRRTILNQDIVFYRGEDGKPIALQNRCAHRSYPLHLGELNGDRIVCNYHGFEYGPDGRCAHVPALDSGRPGIRIQSYPTVEIGPFIWIWTGDPAKVDHSKLLDQPFFTEPGWRTVHGYVYVRANYLGLHENLMDLTHFPFLHSFARGQTDLARHRAKSETIGNKVTFDLDLPGAPVLPEQQKAMQFEGLVTLYTRGGTDSPARVGGRSFEQDCSDPPKIANRYMYHFITPETQTTTHYHWMIARDWALDSQEVDDDFTRITNDAFHEDGAALEEIERLYLRDDRPDFREMLIASDGSGVQVLRLFARLAAAEAEMDKNATTE